MNRVVEDRLLIDDCEKAVLVLRDILKRGGFVSGFQTANDLLERIKKHKEKFTRRVLDKEAYIKKNKALFDLVYANESRKVGGSYYQRRADEIYAKAIVAEKKIYAELVAGGFYSPKTARMDAMRSLMTTYEKLFIKE